MKDILIAMGCMWGVMAFFTAILSVCFLLLAWYVALPIAIVLFILYAISLFKLWDSNVFQKFN